jgi:hypothetical protein
MASDKPTYTPSKRYFDLPNIHASDSWNHLGQHRLSPIVVLPFFKTTPIQRDAILAQLGTSTQFKEVGGSISRGLAIVPWLRNYEPAIEEVIFDLVRGSSEGFVASNPFIFLDCKGLEEGLCVISHYVRVIEGEDVKNHIDGGYDQEFARVPIVQARPLIDSAVKEKSWFPGKLDENCRIDKPDRQGNVEEGWVVIEKGDGIERTKWKWPEHLPRDFKMKEDEPTVVSLIHLSSTEVEVMETEMNKDDEQVVKILNWPSSIEPGSSTDLWHIFEHMKASWSAVAPYEEVFGFFIDSVYLSGPHYKPQVMQVCRSRIADEDIDPGLDAVKIENTITPAAIATSSVRESWKAAWNPTGKGWLNGVRYNHAIREVKGDPCIAQPQLVISNPEAPITACDLPIYILEPITSTQEHALRALFSSAYWEWQIFTVPNAGSVEGLVKWFQSLEYLRYNKEPPHDFVAVDALTLSALDDGDPSFLLGTGATVWHEDGQYLARDEVGYVVGRCRMDECDSYDQWMSRCSMARGLMSCIEESSEEDDTGARRYYWDCFDEGDEELNRMVSTRE